MDLDQVRAFLVLSEELHFRRTAERLYLSQPRVSKLVASLEAEVGAPLFERTSRRVRPTPLAAEFETHLRPAYDAMMLALDTAVKHARAPRGTLRIGASQTIDSPLLFEIIAAHTKSHPQCEISVIETDVGDPYTPLREGRIDMLYNWLVVDEPDLTTSPAIEWRDRALAASTRHPLSSRAAVSLEDLAAHRVYRPAATFPEALSEALSPAATPSGRPIPRAEDPLGTPLEILAAVVTGQVVAPTVATHSRYLAQPNVRLIPIIDMPPLPLGLIWCTARQNARIRSFVHSALSTTSGTTAVLLNKGRDARRGGLPFSAG